MNNYNPLAALCAHILSSEREALQSEMYGEHVNYTETPEIKNSKPTNAAKLKRKAKKRKNARARRKK